MNHGDGDTNDDADNGGGEEDSQEASSLLSTATNVEDALASFKQQWQRELEMSPKHGTSRLTVIETTSTDVSSEDTATVESRAKSLFLKGVEHERSGKLYEAIQFYKRAVQLVPDIEIRLYESTKVKPREIFDSDDKATNVESDISVTYDNDEDDNEENNGEVNLFTKLCRMVNHNQCVCFPKFEQNGTHISALPMEIVLYILKWVVSSELDLRSLEMFSRVCRGFYISARDSEIWRLACIRVWGVACGTYEPKYQSWRDMYVQRPRLRYNGCYICQVTYIHYGENSFQDQFNRPWHLVVYFRCLRFFPEGKVLMLTSTDDAQSCVNSLKSRVPRNSSVLIGHYRLHGNCVVLALKRQESKGNINTYRRRRREPVHDSGEQTFHIELEIQNHHKRLNSLLFWRRYNIFTKYKNGQERLTCLKEPCINSLNISGRYPPLKFSRVKSYTQESEAPLQ